jgi:chemotaxis protein methyltransferase CheR
VAAIPFSDREFKQIADLMYEAVGLSYNESKKSLIHSRLSPRIQKLGMSGFAEYISVLSDESEAVEFQMAVDLLTTNETYFFREPKHYDLLERELSTQRSRAPLAVWSAAASFGDEAYSTAMLLADMQTMGRIGPDWHILATDISHRVLLSAKEAVYPQDRLRAVSPEGRAILKGSPRFRRNCVPACSSVSSICASRLAGLALSMWFFCAMF